MALRPQSLPPVPEATAAAVQAAFPKGNLYVALRAEFVPLYNDQLFADLYPPQGRPVEVAPWRLALVMVMQYIEGLTDRQAAVETSMASNIEKAYQSTFATAPHRRPYAVGDIDTLSGPRPASTAREEP